MTEWPAELNAYRFFLSDRITGGDGGRVALRVGDDQLTYLEVDRLVAGYEDALRGSGVSAGDRVLLVLPDSPDFAAALLATIRMGAVVVMVNPGLLSEAMAAIVDLSAAPAAVVHRDHRAHFSASRGRHHPHVIDPDSVGPRDHHTDPAPTRPRDPAIWLFSGGTTGVPKAVAQTHMSLVNTTRLYGQGSLGLDGDDVTMAIPKLYFGYATGSNLLFPFSVGASAVLFPEHPTPDVIFEQIARHRPTVLVNVPSAINQMLAFADAGSHDLSGLRLVTSAGEALPETLYRRWVGTFGVELLDGLGTAEMWHIFITNTPGEVRPGTLGRVVPGFEIKVCDEDGTEVPTGEVGRLWVRGDSLGLGYVGDPAQSALAFRGEWFVGGDLVSVDSDGFVTHRGRADDAIKVKGKWFRPQELESVLLDHPDVGECAVIVAPDETGLALPVAFVVSTGEAGEQELIDWALARLEPYKHPRRVYFVDELPQTHLGKVDRGALRRAADRQA
ncbi:MAG TPA: benzoate-CoA ligase family protein [Acidimicrobiia bacterium]